MEVFLALDKRTYCDCTSGCYKQEIRWNKLT